MILEYTAATASGKILQLIQHMLEQGDTLKVREQDQTTAPFQYYLMKELQTNITLTKAVEMDDTEINVSSGHGFTTDHHMVIWDGSAFEQVKVTNVNGNIITIEMPVANEFSLDSIIKRGTINMNIDGSSGVNFICGIRGNIPIDIETVMITIQSGIAVPDDGKFGGIAAITNGLYFRQVNGSRTNLGNYRMNKDFRDRGAAVEYTDKAPGGTNGTNIIFDLKDSFGIVIRLNPAINDCVFGRLRDDLSSLDGMTVSLLGQYTLGE